jgi:EAL domain-containing protein (putative c-di-GMP-specific phosphodiesterase class I)
MLGLSVELDLAVADSALHALRRTGAATQVAVNASGLSLQDPAFRTGMAELLARHPAAAAQRLLLELTETAEIEDEAAAVAACDALRAAGLRICVDDFGTGAAGMRYLRAFRPDLVKLEGRFVSAATGPTVPATGPSRPRWWTWRARPGRGRVGADRDTRPRRPPSAHSACGSGQGWLFGRPGALPAASTGELQGAGLNHGLMNTHFIRP